MYISLMYIWYTLQSSSDGGYQARAQAIAHLKPHPTPASEDDQLAKDDDDDDGGDVGDVGIYVDGDGDFVKVMIFLPLLCYVCVAHTDLHLDGPNQKKGHIWNKNRKTGISYLFNSILWALVVLVTCCWYALTGRNSVFLELACDLRKVCLIQNVFTI